MRGIIPIPSIPTPKLYGGTDVTKFFCINKSFFGTNYVMTTLSLVCIDPSIFLDKNAHRHYSIFEVDFGAIPDTIRIIHYTL